jgi:hypothetical protein
LYIKSKTQSKGKIVVDEVVGEAGTVQRTGKFTRNCKGNAKTIWRVRVNSANGSRFQDEASKVSTKKGALPGPLTRTVTETAI